MIMHNSNSISSASWGALDKHGEVWQQKYRDWLWPRCKDIHDRWTTMAGYSISKYFSQDFNNCFVLDQICCLKSQCCIVAGKPKGKRVYD